jgi:hypothetical protein
MAVGWLSNIRHLSRCYCTLRPPCPLHSAPTPRPTLYRIPTSLNLETAGVPLCLRLDPAPAHACTCPLAVRPASGPRWGWCGVALPALFGTSKPTSPLRRRRRYLATARVWDAEKHADRLGAAPRPAGANLGRSGRVSFKQPRSNNHGGRRRPVGLYFGCDPRRRAVAGKQPRSWFFAGWRVDSNRDVLRKRSSCRRVRRIS